jgi:hypothetical protein
MKTFKFLLSGLADGFRLAFFRDVPRERMRAGWGAILVLAALTVAFPILVSIAVVGPAGEWSWYSLPFVLFHLPLIASAAIVAAYALGMRSEVERFMYAALLISFVVDLFTVAALYIADVDPRTGRLFGSLAALPAVWLALAFATYACRSAQPGLRRLAVVATGLVLLALPLASLYRDRTLWHAARDDEASSASDPMALASEDAFYRQPEVLARELKALQPGRKGVVDVYFIGMAGYGNQDVFMREVDSVARLFKERFGSEGRAVRLVNNPKTVLDTPIASMTSLRAALKRIAELMDRDEDVLVLFLTSHGSESHRFSLSLWPLRFNELDPAALRSALDASGIRNRVVIVSACYSGGFVAPLKDDNTVVITASATDRNSFGCSNEAERTYFGKAYFDEALRGTYSFTQAFEQAKPVIAARERRDGYDPSNPQMVVGDAIAARLRMLERQLENAPRR